jgi:PIN domain nuclease of toxin-antitoxin system
MKLLLDTHALVWWLFDDPRLGRQARHMISLRENEIVVSTISAFEIATKHRLRKWPEVATIVSNFETLVTAERFSLLPVDHVHALQAGQLPASHKDPFDRILAAQSLGEDAPLVTVDAAFRTFPISTIW